MFVVWGTKRTVKRLGYAADFCGICRDLCPTRIDRVGAASHVYGLSVGSGELVGHLATCTDCHSSRPIDPATYRELLPRPSEDTTELVRETFPDFEKVYGERLAIEASLRAGKQIPAEAREALLREPFLQLEADVEAVCSGSSRIDKECVIAILAMVLAPIAAGFATSAVFPDEPGSSPAGMVALITFGAGLLGFFSCLATSPGRWIRRKVLPRLARSLHPLQPEFEELDGVHRQLRSLGMRIAKKLTPARIESALAQLEFDPGARTHYDYSRAPRPEAVVEER